MLRGLEELRSTIVKAENLGISEFSDFLFAKELNQISSDNLKIILNTAEKYGLTYISLGIRDLIGVESTRYDRWPAIWKIAKEVGFPDSCGHHDQKQIKAENYFLIHDYGIYNVIIKEKIWNHYLNLYNRMKNIKYLVKKGILPRELLDGND